MIAKREAEKQLELEKKAIKEARYELLKPERFDQLYKQEYCNKVNQNILRKYGMKKKVINLEN